MLKLPRGLRIIERWRIARELELVHHLLRSAVFAFEQKGHENLELDKLGRLILVAARRGGKERFQPIARLAVFLFLEWNLRKVVLRLAKLRVRFQSFLEQAFSLVEILLLHQYFPAQIKVCCLVRIRGIRFIE